MFALVLSLVLIISAVTLVYQYWNGTLAGDPDARPLPMPGVDGAEVPATQPHVRAA